MQLADRGGLPVRRHRFQVISSSEVIPKKTIVSCETVAGYVGVDLTRSICSDEVIWSVSKMQKQITSKASGWNRNLCNIWAANEDRSNCNLCNIMAANEDRSMAR